MSSYGSINSATTQQLGLSNPIFTGGPTEFDAIKTRELEKVGFLCFCNGIYLSQFCVFCWLLNMVT